MAQVNIQSKELLTEYTKQRNDIAQEIYKTNGKSGEEAEALAIAEANKRMESSEVSSKLTDLNKKWYDIIGRKIEKLDPNNVTQIVDLSTGKIIRAKKEDLTTEQAKEQQRLITLKQDLTQGVFLNSKVQDIFRKKQMEMLNNMLNLTTTVEETELGVTFLGFGRKGDRNFAGAIQDAWGDNVPILLSDGNSKTTKQDLLAMRKILSNYKETGLINFDHLTPIEGSTPLIKEYNKNLNTLRALSEVFLMNFDPLKSLENKKAEVESSLFKGFALNPAGVIERAGKITQGMIDGAPEAVGIELAGVNDDELQQAFVDSMIQDFGIGEESKVFDEETGKMRTSNTLQDELDRKLQNVSTYYKVGRSVPTFAVMVAETVAIEFMTQGTGTAAALANIGRWATRLYRGFGIGKRTSTVMGGWTRAMLHEAIILEGSNQIGEHAWGRERLPVWSFAFGAVGARMGITGIGRSYKGFKNAQVAKVAQGSAGPLARKWVSTQKIIKNNPLLLGQPLSAAKYVPKKGLQAFLGTATIKAGELTSTLADVFDGEMQWKEWWDHAWDADSFIETFGAMLVMGARTGLKDVKMGFDALKSDVRNFGTTKGTQKMNNVAEMFGDHLPKIKNYSRSNYKQGKSFWTDQQVDIALEKRVQEISADKKLTQSEKSKQIENLTQLSKFLKLKAELDQFRFNETTTEVRVFGKNTMAGQFADMINRMAEGVESNFMDQLKLGQITSFESGRDRHRVIKEIMAASGMSEKKAQEYVKWCENLANINDQYQFNQGGKAQREFFKANFEAHRLELELNNLKEAYKRGDVNKITLDLESELIKDKQKKLLEAEKKAIEKGAKEWEVGEREYKKRITDTEFVTVPEGKTVSEVVAEIKGEKVEEVDYEATEYGGQFTVSGKNYIITEPAKARTAKADFGENFERTKPIVSELMGLSEGEGVALTQAKKATMFHELVHPLVEKAVSTNKEFVSDFITTLSKAEKDLVWERLKSHVDVAGNKNYKGPEWLTTWAEMVKEGKLDEFIPKGQKRKWRNLGSKLDKTIKTETDFKDMSFDNASQVKEFLTRFAKAEGSELTMLSEVANQGIKDYLAWTKGEMSETAKSMDIDQAVIEDVGPKMIELYKENAADWGEGGWKKAVESMQNEGLLDRLIAAHLPTDRRRQGWDQRMDNAFVESVYGELSPLIKRFSELKQTKSGAEGFFAYINTYLGRKALNVKEQMGAFDFTKSLDKMKEETGYDIADKPKEQEEVYVKATSEQTVKKLGLNEASVEQLNKDMKGLDFPKLVEAYEKPAGRNQTISPFVREFKKQFGEKGTKAVEKSMGTTKAEYTEYVKKNFENIVRSLPIGYVSRNFPFLVTKGGKEVTGTTGRDKRWTSGPKSVKVKENLTEADRTKFVEAAVPSRWGAKKKGLAYQIADNWGSKKFLETIEMKNEIEYKLDQAEKDFNTSRLELDNNEITQTEFNKRRDTYMSKVKELLAQGEVTSQFGEAFKVKQLKASNFVEKVGQQIEISNFRKSAALEEAIRIEAGTDNSLALELMSNAHNLLKEKLKPRLIKEGWPNLTETQIKNAILEISEVNGKPINLGTAERRFVIDNNLARGMAKNMLVTAKKVIKGYKGSKKVIEEKVTKKYSDLSKEKQREILKDEVEAFEIEKMINRTLEGSEGLKVQKRLGIDINAKEAALKRADEMVANTMKFWTKRIVDAFKEGKDPIEVVENLLKFNVGHLVTAGGTRGKRGQSFSGKPDLFGELKPILEQFGIDLEYQLYEKGHAKEGNLKPGSLKVDGTKLDLKTKHQSANKLKWLSDTVKNEISKDPNWAKNNPEKFQEIAKIVKERKTEAKEFKEAMLGEMTEYFKDWLNGEIDTELLFLQVNSFNSNMTTHLRSSAPLRDVQILLEGDLGKNLTLEHKRAADSLLRDLVSIYSNKNSWTGSGNKLRLKASAKKLIDKAFEGGDGKSPYQTALMETYAAGEIKTADKLLTEQFQTERGYEIIKGGEDYGRYLNLATFGDPRSGAILNLEKFVETGGDFEASKYGKEHEIAAKMARNKEVTAADRKVVENIGLWNKSATKGKTKKELIEITKTADKALEHGREINPKKKKARIFDFDDTVARTNSKVFATKGGEKKILTAEEFAKEGERLINEGWKMDFSDFNKVVEGKKGPLFDLMKKMKESPGDRDMFILTARSQESAPAIHEFLKAMGIDIPLENIKGLGNSTGEAKAEWIVNKAAEGYNDFYFADDAVQNVEAVKKALEPIDVKSKVQQARFNRSAENLDMMFNKIIENKTGIEWQKEFSSAKAKVRGKENQKRKFWIPPSAEDFTGLMDFTLGKGKVGEQQREFYNETLYKPYSRGVNSLATERVNMMGDFKAIKNQLKVPKDLREKTKSGFTKEQAVRVYLWNRTGQKIPGLSKTDLAELNTIIESDGKLHAFAESILQLTKGDGYSIPKEHWLSGTITTDLIDVLSTTKRNKYLKEWRDNIDVIFSKKNMNKLEAAYGPKYREALENMLTRMKSGKNRTETGNRLGNQVLDYINNAQGTIMFLNMRSAILQTISSANFINIGFNNPIKAGKAFANQPQYWKDFMELMNSDYLVDRRNGLKMNISESEIADAAATSSNKAKAAVNYIIEKGYTPTRFADSFAIASGGATWYRNRINDLMKKEGLSEEAAKAKAYEEFMEISEKSQQSSDPSKISMQQSSDVGRIFLQFVNTPMQYARLQKAAFKDIVNKRGDWKSNVSKIIYYGVIQNLWFNMMQQGAFALGFGDEATEEDVDEKGWDTANGAVDSILRGIGLGGMTVSVLKNFVMDIVERSQKERPEYSDAWETLLEFSPALKSKLKKIKSAGRPFDSKKGRQQMIDKGFSLDNPAFESFAKVFSAATNVPLDRVLQKIENLQGVANSENETWMRVAMFLGWPEWQLQTKDEKDKSRKEGDPSLYNKAQQVDILKQHGYSDEEIKAMKDKETRTNAILDKQEKSGKIYTTKIGTGPLKASPMRYNQYQLDSLEYTKLNKPRQVEMLDSLGLSKKEIRALKYEADRVEKLLELMKDD